MRLIKLMLLLAFVLIGTTSCSDKSDDNLESVEDISVNSKQILTMDLSEKSEYRYRANGTTYDIVSGKESGTIVSILSDDSKYEQEVPPWEKPDDSKGEYSSCELEHIDNKEVILVFKNFSNEIKINWRMKFNYKEGTYQDFLNGKFVKLVHQPQESEKYFRALSKGLIASMSSLGIDLEKSTCDFTTKKDEYLLSKKEIINLAEEKIKITLFVSEEIHEEMLNTMKQNMSKK
jgi:hypothetical protein